MAVLLIVIIVLGLFIYFGSARYDKTQEEFKAREKDNYKFIKNKYLISNDVVVVDYINGIRDIDYIDKDNEYAPKEFYLWRDNENIYVMGKPSYMWAIDEYFKKSLDLCKKIVLNINNIEYFHLTGQQLTITKGEGGGSSLGGMAVGGILGGGVGAVVGSRKKTNISTEVLDQRNTILVYNNPITNNVEHITFPPNVYDLFLKLMPNKEIEYIKSKAK